MSEYQNLLLESQDGVLTISLNHPKANAFNLAMITDLQKALKAAARDQDVRVVVLTGHGKIFSAGQDLQELRQVGEQEMSLREHLQQTYNPLITQIRTIDKPVIAAVNGPVAGAGLGVALACDLRIAADSARFVVGFLGIGLVPDSGVSITLPLLIGLARASEFSFTNQPISAQQALEWGMINRIAPAEEVKVQAQQWAALLAQGPVGAMGLTKRVFNKVYLLHLEQALDYEGYIQDIAARRSEHREGIAAFLEKRPPKFV